MQVGSEARLIHCLASTMERLDRPHGSSEAWPSETPPSVLRVITERYDRVQFRQHSGQLAEDLTAHGLLGDSRLPIRGP